MTSYGSNNLLLLREIKHFQMSSKRRLVATTWGPYLARPSNEVYVIKKNTQEPPFWQSIKPKSKTDSLDIESIKHIFQRAN